MKKVIAVIIVLTLVLLTACGTTTVASDEGERMPYEKQTIEAKCVPVGLTVNEDGYYCIFADVGVDLIDDEIVNIEIEETALLSFKVSSIYGGGVYVIGLDDGAYMIDSLTETVDELRQSGNEELAERLENILEIIMYSGPYTQAST